jgi:hypothetical protein
VSDGAQGLLPSAAPTLSDRAWPANVSSTCCQRQEENKRRRGERFVFVRGVPEATLPLSKNRDFMVLKGGTCSQTGGFHSGRPSTSVAWSQPMPLKLSSRVSTFVKLGPLTTHTTNNIIQVAFSRLTCTHARPQTQWKYLYWMLPVVLAVRLGTVVHYLEDAQASQNKASVRGSLELRPCESHCAPLLAPL